MINLVGVVSLALGIDVFEKLQGVILKDVDQHRQNSITNPATGNWKLSFVLNPVVKASMSMTPMVWATIIFLSVDLEDGPRRIA